MPGSRKTQLHAVPETTERSMDGLEEMRQKIRLHRMKFLILILAIAGVMIIAVNIVIYYLQNLMYTDYEVVETMERIDTAASEFLEFNGQLLKYTKDGAVYSDFDGAVIWNQSYEMEMPCVSTCGEYLAIYDKGGTGLYILDKEGLRGTIKSTVPIQCVSIANQGVVAVLTEDRDTSYLQIYNQSGKELAAGEFHIEDGGFPLAIALSEDAQMLAVSRLDINEGDVKSTIVFYNYGSVGQNEIDNIVGVYSYSNIVIPEIKYVSNHRLLAFGDTEIIIYEGEQKPVVAQEVDLKEEMLSVFYSEAYFGIVFNGSQSNNYLMKLYNMKGSCIREIEFVMDYKDIYFLENNLICIQNDKRCAFYTITGNKRFDYTFDKDIYGIVSGLTQRDYVFILNGETARVKLTK